MRKLALIFVVLSIHFAAHKVRCQNNMLANSHNLINFLPNEKFVTSELIQLTPSEFHNHPEFGILPYNAPCSECYELLQYRTDTTRMFVERGSEGTKFYSQTSFGAINFKNDDNQWISYDPRLKQNYPGLYTASNQDFPMNLDVNSKSTSFKTSQGNHISFNNNLTLIHVLPDSSEVDMGIANWDNYSIGENGIRIIDAWPNIDIQIIFLQGAIKTNYIIKSNLGITDGYLVFRDYLTGSNNESMNYYGDLIEVEGINAVAGMISYINNVGDGVFISPAVGYDQSQLRENSLKLGYTIGEDHFDTWAPTSWINNSNMVYPVVIDPTVTSSTTYTAGIMRFRYLGSFCGGANPDCGYTLNAARPANSTLTGATFSLVQTTIAGGCFFACWMADAGYYFSSSCGVNGYWGCNVNNPGTCTATNLDISNLVTCLAPACSGNVPITIFNSYCYCNYGVACAATCHSINNNTWIVTLTGTTLETLGNTVTGNGSQTINDADCIGTSVLNPLGSGGVPGYTYSWSTGATTPTITVNNTPAVYTVTVTDACGVSRVATFNIGCPLPVRIDYFNATLSENIVHLKWKTKFEEDIDHFIIQRSDLNGDFQNISEIDCGNTPNGKAYNLIDKEPLGGVSYYRLGVVYENGEVEFLDAVKIVNAKKEISIFPNPGSGIFNLTFYNPNKESFFVEVVNSNGTIVYHQKFVSPESYQNDEYDIIQIDLSNLQVGIYTLQVSNEDRKYSEKLIIH